MLRIDIIIMMKMTTVTMIAAEISIWATGPIWRTLSEKVANQTLPICLPLRRKSFANIAWRKWRERWITKPLRCATSKDNMTGYFPGCAEWVSGCKTSASRHDAILKWPLLNFQMESQERQIPHLSLCPSLPKPCGARLGNRQLHKGFFKTLSVWSNHYQIIIKPPSMIVRTGKMWARSATESLPTIGVNPILPAAERKTFTQTSQNR